MRKILLFIIVLFLSCTKKHNNIEHFIEHWLKPTINVKIDFCESKYIYKNLYCEKYDYVYSDDYFKNAIFDFCEGYDIVFIQEESIEEKNTKIFKDIILVKLSTKNKTNNDIIFINFIESNKGLILEDIDFHLSPKDGL